MLSSLVYEPQTNVAVGYLLYTLKPTGKSERFVQFAFLKTHSYVAKMVNLLNNDTRSHDFIFIDRNDPPRLINEGGRM